MYIFIDCIKIYLLRVSVAQPSAGIKFNTVQIHKIDVFSRSSSQIKKKSYNESQRDALFLKFIW